MLARRVYVQCRPLLLLFDPHLRVLARTQSECRNELRNLVGEPMVAALDRARNRPKPRTKTCHQIVFQCGRARSSTESIIPHAARDVIGAASMWPRLIEHGIDTDAGVIARDQSDASMWPRSIEHGIRPRRIDRVGPMRCFNVAAPDRARNPSHCFAKYTAAFSLQCGRARSSTESRCRSPSSPKHKIKINVAALD